MQSGGNQVGPARATPEDRVIHLAKLWRQADKVAATSKQHSDSTREYRLRQELRNAIDKLPP